MKSMESFAKVNKETVIAACNNCLEDDRAWRKKSRDKFIIELQNPAKFGKPLLKLAQYSKDDYVYLSASDAEFVKSWEK